MTSRTKAVVLDLQRWCDKEHGRILRALSAAANQLSAIGLVYWRLPLERESLMSYERIPEDSRSDHWHTKVAFEPEGTRVNA
jgi:hypothetical protein